MPDNIIPLSGTRYQFLFINLAPELPLNNLDAIIHQMNQVTDQPNYFFLIDNLLLEGNSNQRFIAIGITDRHLASLNGISYTFVPKNNELRKIADSFFRQHSGFIKRSPKITAGEKHMFFNGYRL